MLHLYNIWWVDAIEVSTNYSNTKYDKNPTICAQNFMSIHECNINLLISEPTREVRKNLNKTELPSNHIIKINFLWETNIAFRGYEDNTQLTIEETEKMYGNFRALVWHCARGGDTHHMTTSGSVLIVFMQAPLYKTKLFL